MKTPGRANNLESITSGSRDKSDQFMSETNFKTLLKSHSRSPNKGPRGERRIRIHRKMVGHGLALFIALLAATSCFCQSNPSYDRVDIAALDPDAWNGIVFSGPGVPTNRQVLRFGSDRNPQSPAETFVDGAAIDNNIGESWTTCSPTTPIAAWHGGMFRANRSSPWNGRDSIRQQ